MNQAAAPRPVATTTATRISIAIVMVASVVTLGVAGVGLLLWWIGS